MGAITYNMGTDYDNGYNNEVLYCVSNTTITIDMTIYKVQYREVGDR